MLLFGCAGPSPAERVADVDPFGWRTPNPATIAIPMSDTTGSYDISLLVRVGRGFGERMQMQAQVQTSTLPLTIKTVAPDSTYCEEAIDPPLAGLLEESPAPAAANFTEVSALYRSGVTFRQSGEYTFVIAPRTDGVRGVWGVGISIKCNDDGQK